MRPVLLCWLLLAAGSGQAADNLGRLFMTPVERSRLDHLRQIKPVQEDRRDAMESKTISVQGYVKRHDHRGTAWINHQAMQESSVQDDIRIGAIGDGGVRLKLQSSDQRVALQAGQSYDPVSGKIMESPNTLTLSVQAHEKHKKP